MAKKKVIFLDRDGVINEFPGLGNYVTSKKNFKFIPGSLEGMKKLSDAGFTLFVASNQQGVAKGLYSQKDLDEITKAMTAGFKKANVPVAGVYYCIHAQEENCLCRKPKTGMLTQALAQEGCEAEPSFFVGDSFVDLKTARAFGAKSVLLLSGREKISNRSSWEFEPDYVFDTLLVAAHYLCSHYG